MLGELRVLAFLVGGVLLAIYGLPPLIRWLCSLFQRTDYYEAKRRRRRRMQAWREKWED